MANRLTSLIRTISSVHPVVRSVTSTGPLNLVYFSSQAARCCGTGVGLPMFRKGGKTQLSVCSLMPSVSGTWMISNMSYRKKKKRTAGTRLQPTPISFGSTGGSTGAATVDRGAAAVGSDTVSACVWERWIVPNHRSISSTWYDHGT